MNATQDSQWMSPVPPWHTFYEFGQMNELYATLGISENIVTTLEVRYPDPL